MSTGFAVSGPARGAADSVVELDNGPRWPIETEAAAGVLAEYYGADVAGQALVPPSDPVTLRARLRSAAPQLAGLTDEVRRRFDGGACGVLVTQLGLAGLAVDQRRKVVFALSVLLGDVTGTHPVDHRVMWDVRASESTKYSSFSENDQEAEYHTDSSPARVPDHYFLLYSVRAAECGGGQTFLTDARVLLDELEQTERGRAAVRILSEATIPMRVPTAFRKDGIAEADGYSYTPVISPGPLWRFRKDKIEKGLLARPEYATDEVRRSLDLLYERLDSRQDEYRAAIPTDAVLIVDNHVALHGRTAFTDPGRHLLRARFHQPMG